MYACICAWLQSCSILSHLNLDSRVHGWVGSDSGPMFMFYIIHISVLHLISEFPQNTHSVVYSTSYDVRKSSRSPQRIPFYVPVFHDTHYYIYIISITYTLCI